MDTLQERIHEYLPLNELEQLLKYLFQNHISYDQIDFDSRELLENVNPEKDLSKEETLQKFKQMIQSAACSSYLKLFPDNYDIMKVKADLLIAGGETEAGEELYRRVQDCSRNGLDLLYIGDYFSGKMGNSIL